MADLLATVENWGAGTGGGDAWGAGTADAWTASAEANGKHLLLSQALEHTLNALL